MLTTLNGNDDDGDEDDGGIVMTNSWLQAAAVLKLSLLTAWPGHTRHCCSSGLLRLGCTEATPPTPFLPCCAYGMFVLLRKTAS